MIFFISRVEILFEKKCIKIPEIILRAYLFFLSDFKNFYKTIMIDISTGTNFW